MRVQNCLHDCCAYNKDCLCTRQSIVIGEAGECGYSSLLNLLRFAGDVIAAEERNQELPQYHK